MLWIASKLSNLNKFNHHLNSPGWSLRLNWNQSQIPDCKSCCPNTESCTIALINLDGQHLYLSYVLNSSQLVMNRADAFDGMFNRVGRR